LADVGQSDLPDLITESKLGIIYPNPTREGITINYDVAADELNGGMVSIQVYDLSGRLVSNLVNRKHEPGCYSVSWGGSYENGGGPVPRGIYYIRFTAGSVKEVQQIMLVR
jgi:flagellar hook assembly protein FlgD